MKAITLLILMAFSAIFAQSQDIFISNSEAGARKLSDTIAANAMRHYTFNEAKYPKYMPDTYVISFTADSNQQVKLAIMFDIVMKGANKDLEITGTKELHFKMASGKYLDLFPFWQKFINPTADINIIPDKGRDEIKTALPEGKSRHFYFSRSGDEWTIRIL